MLRTRPTALVVALGLSLVAGCAPVSDPGAGARTAASTAAEGEQPAAGTVGGWPTADPAEMGFRPVRLRTLAREAKARNSSCYAVVRRGRLVLERNFTQQRSSPREVFSVTKSVASALVGIAVREGLLALDDPASDYVEEWRGTASDAVTVRHLLSNDSGRLWSMASDYSSMVQATNRTAYAVGLTQQHPPGTAWAYNNAAIQVLDRVISTASGQTTAEFAEERLFRPLGMTRSRLTADDSGQSTNTFFGMQTTCLDLARFARLYLAGGEAAGVRLLPRWWVRQSVATSQTEHNAAYGFLWWINHEGRLRGATDQVDAAGQPLEERTGQLVPGAPESVYAAIGLFGQTVMVDPTSRTIVVRLGGTGGKGDYGLGDATRVVTWASRPG